MRFRRRLVPVLAMVAILLVGGVLPAAPAHAQTPTDPPTEPRVSCQVSYVLVAQWGTGFTAAVTVVNTGEVPATWRVTIIFHDSEVGYGWNGVLTIGRWSVIIEPPAWAPLLAPGQSVTAGLTGTGSGVPTSVEVTCQPARPTPA